MTEKSKYTGAALGCCQDEDMIMDLDVVRSILKSAQGAEGVSASATGMGGHDQCTIDEHVILLRQGGFIGAGESLTTEGQCLAADLSSDGDWLKCKALLAQRGGSAEIAAVRKLVAWQRQSLDDVEVSVETSSVQHPETLAT